MQATVLRGGSWNNQSRNARVSHRNNNQPSERNNNNGFRCSGECGNCQSRASPVPVKRHPSAGALSAFELAVLARCEAFVTQVKQPAE